MYKYKEHLDFPFHNHFNFLAVIYVNTDVLHGMHRLVGLLFRYIVYIFKQDPFIVWVAIFLYKVPYRLSTTST